MGPIIRNLKSFSGALLSLAVMLIVLMWVLNWLSSRGLGPLSTAAAWTQSHVSGQTAPVAPVASPQAPSNGYRAF